jgi:dCTP deaminase
MILCDRDLKSLARSGWLVRPYDEKLLNPASIDIRVGQNIIREKGINHWQDQYIGDSTYDVPVQIEPGEFILVETLEEIIVPSGYSIDCKLKSTMARKGLDHSLAFWFDPGWHGIGTFELRNVTRHQTIHVWYGMCIAQIIVHRLSGAAEHPYAGRYQGAKRVELAKSEI